MAALDKLVKALEGLKIIKESTTFSDEALKRKEKATLCVTVADLMCSPAARNAPKLPYYLSYSMETLLHMCDDPDSDIRMTADESLNRIIRAMMENNIVKVQVELHKEIKKNGSARSLRAALWRFAELAHMIRPQKGKPYVQNLVPCIIQIAKRTEEPVLETLAAAMPKIFSALGSFTTDNDIKSLLRTFLSNIASEQTVVRRTAATSIMAICLNCRKSQVFLCYTLNTILDSVLPVRDDQPLSDVLGVLNLTRQLLLHLDMSLSSEDASYNNNNNTSFLGSARANLGNSTYPSVDRFLQVYELCLHWSNHQDHNVVTASLETLQQLLICVSSSPMLTSTFVSNAGLSLSRILPSDNISKYSMRTLSEMSVATPSLVPGDESSLLDATEDCMVKSRLEQWMQESVPHDSPTPTLESDDMDQQQSDYMSTLDSDCMPSTPAMPIDYLMQRAPSLESEQLLGRDESPTPPPSEISSEIRQVWDIGTAVDTGPALVYCARHLVTKFLLPDQGGPRVRVSVRALALSCLGQVLNLMPKIFLMNIDRRHQTTSSGFSHISDVLTFVNHSDQQLRGLTMTLIGQLIKAALCEGRASFCDWSNSNMSACETVVGSSKTTSCAASASSIVHPSSDKLIQLETLVSFLVQGLEDESAICVRHTMTGVEICLSVLLSSKDSNEAVPLLHAFANLTVNPYWLIKVKMIELLSRLNYLNIYYIIGNNSFQDKVFESVMLSQLGDQDNRVRKATAEAIARIVENLFYPIDHSQEDLVTSYGLFIRQKLLSGIFDQDNPVEVGRPNMKIESALSRIVSLLSYLLLQSTSKYLTAGCCETLGLLSVRFPCKLYRRAWQCHLGRVVPATKCSTSPAAGLLATVLAFLTSAPVSLDLDSHHWLLLLAGNLYTGLAESSLLNADLKTEYDKTQLWSATGDKKFGVLSEQLLSHVMRVLSVFVLVLEDQPSVSQRGGLAPSPVKRRPSRAASPAKSSAISSEKEVLNITAGATSKEEKGKSFGHFSHLPHYCRMHDNLASAYKNYKVTLEGAASEKFVNLLRMVLTVLGQILEYCGLAESGRIAEEILHYLRATVVLDATTSVSTVQQLLKSLFGANFLAHWEDERERGEKKSSTLSVIQDTYTGFYGNVFQQPYQKLSDYLEANSKISNDVPRGGPSYVRERATAPKSIGRNSDKAALASYIRLFEPMVIQALKKYTITSDVSLQMAVLELLTQLVRLRVNYCLLDSDQIFISFIFKQFEFLEEGQITRASELIPKLFQFLVHLSHEKNHSKPVISFPRVIQLCAGLMASGQNPLTHCIPALLPVVEHVFLANVTNLADAKELETQREFLISMLLRLAEYPQVLHLLGVILKEGWRWEERWRKWSRLTADTVLPMLAQDKVLLDSPESLACLLHLINSLAPGTLRPVDQILKVLFNTQQPQDGCSTERWLRIVLTMIIALICQGKEDSVLSRLEELQLCVHQQGDDPLNVTAAKLNHPPQLIFANLLLHVVELVMIQIESLTRRSQDVTQFEQLFAHFLLCCIVMFQSGSYLQVATALMDLVHENEGLRRLEAINSKFESLSSCCPLLTLLWSYLLTLINYGQTSYWSILLQTKDRDKIGGRRNVEIEIQPEQCLNLEFVRRGVTILFCDYATENISDSECLTWLMIGHIEELIRLSTEPPVQELLAAVHRNPAASGLMVQAVSTRCSHITQVRFLCRLLTCLESVHPRDSGAVLKLLAPILTKHPHLVISRRSTALASRRTELLLTLEKSEVLQQLTKDDLQKLLESLTSSSKLAVKHSGLVSLLNKLGAQCYDLSPIELEQGRQVNTASIRTIMLDRDWFLTQVKLRCCGKGKNGPQCALLLSQLSEEDIVSVLRSQNFDNSILQHCFTLGTRLTLQGCKEVKNQNEIQLSLLFTAARLALLHHVHHLHSLLPRVHQVYHPVGRPYTTKELKYKERVDELLCDPEFIKVFFHLVPAVCNFMLSVSELEKFIDLGSSTLIPPESWDALSKFSILCMESIVWMIENNKSWCGGKWPNCMYKALECTLSILKVDRLMSLLSISHLGSVVSCLVSLIHKHTDHTVRTPVLQGDGESTTKLHTCYQMAALISLIEKSPPELWDLPAVLSINIGKLIICMGRSASVNWHCRTPLEGWGPPDPGPLSAPPPILSSHLLQDIDILSLVVFRMSWLGWTTRQQFEESWMTLLSVVRANSPTDPQIELEQAANIIQGNSLTVKALTSLLLQTTLLPNPGNPCTGQLLHCSRDEPIDLSNQNWGPKLLAANESLCWKLKDLDKTSCSNVRLLRMNERPNIERRIGSQKRYGYSQVSVSYMKTAVMSIEERSTSSEKLCNMCIEQEQRLAALNLDVRSCIQFLLDLYSQWTLPGGGLSLSVLLEIVRSTVCLSDLFSERSHFSWMLDICLELSRTHPQEDEIMHQYLVVAVCKAASVLPALETEVIERVIKLLDNALKCNFLPARLAAVHGLLYLLQCQLMVKVDGETLEQKQPVVDTRQKLLQLSLDFVSKNLSTDISTDSSEESLLTLYALAFYLLEHSPQDVPQDIFPTILQLTQNAASNKVTNIYNALIQGIDRLVLVSNSPDIRAQSTRLATEILVHTNPAISMPALQLLLSCIYSGDYDKGKERQEESSPEVLVAAIEKASTLFNRIKWAYPVEAECVCSILPHLLGDFFPASEVLSKVIGEFLAPKQPHPHLISPVVFQVFSQACREQQLPLLQAWVVMSLPNFTQGIPVPIATWCLSCFFISASTNPWLRSLFPHVQSRIGKCTYEDRKLLCIAASDFYNQLSDDSQKKTFLQTFTEAACTPKSPFSDIIACISHT